MAARPGQASTAEDRPLSSSSTRWVSLRRLLVQQGYFFGRETIFDFSVFWDNRDFYANPTRGFSLRGRCSRDFGWLDSSNSWTNVDAELDGCYHRMNTPPVVRSASCS